MIRCQLVRIARTALFSLLALSALSPVLYAQTAKLEGLIKARSGATVILQTADSPKTIVLLDDSTRVAQIEGVFKVRRKDMSMAALIPGLAIQVEGTYNEQNQLMAASIKFKGNDLERAKSIEAGLHETQTRTRENAEELTKQNTELQAQSEALKDQQKQLTAEQQKAAANKRAIDAAMARFGQLSDYYILDEMVVHFGNGKTGLDAKYKPMMMEFAKKAKGVEAYMVQVVGYASSSGSDDINQKLSEDRAHSVTNFLVQQAHIPLTNMLAPGAMGESRQISNKETADVEAENRRVVVRVLQNKGIAGTPETGL
jgi:OmpA-OmpF porin, OOP family